jgi:MFS family permease
MNPSTTSTPPQSPHEPQVSASWRGTRWRWLGWGAAIALWLTPLVSMPFTEEVQWDWVDFVAAGILLSVPGLLLELTVRMTRNTAYRLGVAVGLLAALLLVWISLAVGIIGSEDNPANLLYVAVLATAVGGAIAAGLRAAGMARAMFATAAAQMLVGLLVLAAGLGFTLIINAFFALLWCLSAGLFRAAAEAGAR